MKSDQVPPQQEWPKAYAQQRHTVENRHTKTYEAKMAAAGAEQRLPVHFCPVRRWPRAAESRQWIFFFGRDVDRSAITTL